MIVKLTPLQSEIIMHRAGVPDCVFESLEIEDGVEYNDERYDLVEAYCERLYNDAQKFELSMKDLNELQYRVLLDVIQWSTVMGDYTPREQRPAMAKAGDELAELINKLSGSNIKFPHH